MAEQIITTLDAQHLLGFKPFTEVDSPQSVTYLNKLLREMVTSLNILLKAQGSNLTQLANVGVLQLFEFTGDGATTEWEMNGLVMDDSHPIVMLNGLGQKETTHFTWSNATPTAARIVFLQAPRNGAKGMVFYAEKAA